MNRVSITSNVGDGRDVAIITPRCQTAVINMEKALKDKVESTQEQIPNKGRRMKILKVRNTSGQKPRKTYKDTFDRLISRLDTAESAYRYINRNFQQRKQEKQQKKNNRIFKSNGIICTQWE